MDWKDILKRAGDNLIKAPLPKGFDEHGEYCPYCAVAMAKSQLDDEGGTGMGLSEQLRQLATGFQEVESDKPLVDAANLLGKIPEPFTKEKTLHAFDEALLRVL